jgi:predicted TIM-barrel fold metal-dependent hydrolase
MSTERLMTYFGGGWRYEDPARPGPRAKVIDAHCHIFPRFGTGSGPESAELTLRLWQYHLRDFTEIWRRSDGARVSEPLLDFPGDGIETMPDVNFRMGRYGQAEFTVDAVDYYVQLYPPGLENLEATPQRMIAEMDCAGVDVGVLQSDHVYGLNIDEYYAAAMQRYPGRFVGLAQIREPDANRPDQLARLERAVREFSCRGLYFSVELFALGGYVDHIDDQRFEPLWELVRRLGLSVWWYLDSRRADRVAGFMERVAEVDRWAERHPDIPTVLTHGIVPAKIIHAIGLSPEVWRLLKRPNIYAEVLMPAKWPEYPFVQGQAMLKQLCDEVGVGKLMWGSDMPYCGGSWCTYRQAADYIRLHCDFLSPDEKDLILGGNAARMFGLETAAPA